MRVLTIGTFDLFHVGHLNLIQNAARYAHELVVGVNSDRFVIEYKKRLPVVPEDERLRIVAGMKHVDRALLNDGPGRELIERVRPNALAIGSDWHENRYLAQLGLDQDWLEETRTALLYLPRTPGVSSSARRLKLAA